MPSSLVTSTSAKALQRSAADKIAYLFDGSMVFAYWTGTTGQVSQITSPLTSPSVATLITTTDDAISLWADNSSGTSSDIWVASSGDDAASSGVASVKLRHGTYNGSSFTWDTSTAVPGAVSPNTIQCSVAWNGTYLMVFWWDGTSGTDRISYAWTTDKTGTTGWQPGVRAACFSESQTWSTVNQVNARHSAKLGATIITYGGNSAMHYACMPDSSSSGPVTGATLSNTGTWSGTASSSVGAGVIMAVKPSGATPVTSLGTPSQARSTSSPVTGSWSSDQTRTSGDLLVAVVSATGTTSAAATAQNTGTSGWTKQFEAGAGTASLAAVWTKTAAGADAAPAFTSVISGTATMTCTLLVLKNAATSSFTDASGTLATSGSLGTETVTTSGNIATNGDFALSVLVRERTAGTTTYTPAIGWSNVANDGATSSTGHCAVDVRGGPDITRWGGRSVFDQFTDNYVSFGGPQLAIDESSGAIHCVRAAPNAGGPTWTGVTYWAGTYNSGPNTVTWGTRVIVDSASTATGPADIAVTVDSAGKAWVLWTTDTSADNLRYATLVSPFTSASAATTLVTGAAPPTPRFPHVPAVSQANAGLTSAIPVLYMDTTSSPFPVYLNTTVSLTTAVSDSDTGSGAETAAAGVTSAEAGTGAEGSSLAVSLPGADSGSGSDGAVIAVSDADAGSGADGGTVAASVPGAEAGAGLDAAMVSVTGSDSGSGAEAAVVMVSGSDAGSAADAGSVAIADPGAGSGADSGTIAAAVPGSDAGAGIEAGTVSVSDAETGSGSDGGSVAASLAGTDAGSGADAAAIAASDADTGAGADSGSVTAAVPSPDTGSGTDAGAVPGAFTDTDTGTGADGAAALAAVPGADSGAASDAAAVSVSSQDAGTGADSGAVTLGVSGADPGSGADSGTPAAVLAGAETAAGADAGSIAVLTSDTGPGADSAAVTAVSSDAGTGPDSGQVTAALSAGDTGTGADAGAVTLPGGEARLRAGLLGGTAGTASLYAGTARLVTYAGAASNANTYAGSAS